MHGRSDEGDELVPPHEAIQGIRTGPQVDVREVQGLQQAKNAEAGEPAQADEPITPEDA